MAFNYYTNIVKDTVKELSDVHFSKVYNELVLNYDYNPATDTFNKCLSVLHTDQASFPLVGTLVSGTSIPLWTTYVTGIVTYATAETLWNTFHTAWLLTRQTNQYKKDLRCLVDEAPWGGTTDSDTAIKLATKLAYWITSKKRKISFDLDVAYSAQSSSMELLEPCAFNHPYMTDNVLKIGWITGLTMNPKTDKINVEIIILA